MSWVVVLVVVLLLQGLFNTSHQVSSAFPAKEIWAITGFGFNRDVSKESFVDSATVWFGFGIYGSESTQTTNIH